MKIITLIENTKNKNLSQELISEQGLCLYIEKDNKCILFDTGRKGNFINNAQKLGIDLKKVDVVVISHGHGDHGGGLLEFFKINSKAKVYMKRNAKNKYYFRYLFLNIDVSIDEKVFEKYSKRIRYIDSFTEIMDEIFIITDIYKQYKVPRGNKYLYIKEGTKLVPDKFHHELIMIIKEAKGICIFAGCSHNGISNIIETSKNAFPNMNIKAVIGGFHLVTLPIIKSLSASQWEINEIAKKIINTKVEKVYTGHCTGEKAYKKLKSILGDKIEYIRTGSEVNI
ncbi:MBL fold metallo-hydrolase [Clostridium brassicae]|uniref:MBL fold metallo-hydrolase n=1 Tax=Clostridium brassicae TaxID=2999072 RepID=A0ABT4D4R7_9CLOT|nr:MBL fold metallo-hydrolase [Clostridium brassicae]MCY6957277.1 MBL fold metallo-hydrolase [Clostridium brassicae]